MADKRKDQNLPSTGIDALLPADMARKAEQIGAAKARLDYLRKR